MNRLVPILSRLPWPPPGVSLVLEFAGPDTLGVGVNVNYKLFDGIPLLSKWNCFRNATPKPVRLHRYRKSVV